MLSGFPRSFLDFLSLLPKTLSSVRRRIAQFRSNSGIILIQTARSVITEKTDVEDTLRSQFSYLYFLSFFLLNFKLQRFAFADLIDSRIKISDVRGKISDVRGKISDVRGKISDVRGKISDVRGKISDVRGKISDVRGKISDVRGKISDISDAFSRVPKISYRLFLTNLCN
ncbi:hypothetical protein PUN28_016985 [Cardiocondyla obscurior]|uniref:t-SNARE coiled-coil homology domain-containing protein n=1 Tax=Cardiocondyla obscurior TaxID=286306 RepID=A0AAW2EJU5_9HYME